MFLRRIDAEVRLVTLMIDYLCLENRSGKPEESTLDLVEILFTRAVVNITDTAPASTIVVG